MKATGFNWKRFWKRLNKYLRYLFWIGPVLMIMGVTAGIVAGSWGVVPSGLLITGIIVIGLWLLVESYSQPEFWQRRSTVASFNALLSTLAMLVILGSINFLAARFDARTDLTENQLFTLAPQSQEVVQNLQQPTKAWIFAPTPNPADQQLLDNYRRQGNQFSYEYVDPQAQPGIAKGFGVKSIGEVYLEVGNTHKFVQTLTPGERLSERRLTNGILQVLNARQQKVYFLQGHGERTLEAGQGGMAQATGRLTEESYTFAPLNLAATPKVPEDASVLVMAGPQRPLLESEVTALKDYLKRKSGLMLMVDPQTDPKLDWLLKDWGIKAIDRLITDPAGQSSGLGPGVVIVNQYGEHPITRGLGNGISFYPLARPIQTLPEKGIQAAPLLITSDRTLAQRIAKSGELQFDPTTDPRGPFDLGVALSRPVTLSAASSATNAKPSVASSKAGDAQTPAETQTSPSAQTSVAQPSATAKTDAKPGKAQASPSPEGTPESLTAASPSPKADDQTKNSPSPNSPKAETPASPAKAETQAQSRLVVIGSSGFATDGVFAQQLNGDVFLNSVSWLSQQDDQVLAIRPNEMTNRRIVMSPQQQMTVALVSVALLPLIGFGAAAGVWWRRR
jgi:ABC-type uncharacterized transport system involved in gliding motility auxiliary subunit